MRLIHFHLIGNFTRVNIIECYFYRSNIADTYATKRAPSEKQLILTNIKELCKTEGRNPMKHSKFQYLIDIFCHSPRLPNLLKK